jgi:hypothetical protein
MEVGQSDDDDDNVSERSFGPSSSESEMSVFKTRFGLPRIGEDAEGSLDGGSYGSSQEGSSLAPLLRSTSLEEMFHLFQENGDGDMVINSNEGNELFGNKMNDINSSFSEDFEEEIFRTVSDEELITGEATAQEGLDDGLKKNSLEGIDKLSPQNKVADWLGPDTVEYNDEFSMDMLNIVLAQSSKVDSDIKKAKETAANESDHSEMTEYDMIETLDWNLDILDEQLASEHVRSMFNFQQTQSPQRVRQAKAAIVVQKSFRGAAARKNLWKQYHAIKHIQRVCRGHRQRVLLKRKRQSATTVQKTYRRHSSRRRVHQMRKRAQHEVKLVRATSNILVQDITKIAIQQVAQAVKHNLAATKREIERQRNVQSKINQKRDGKCIAAASIQKIFRGVLARSAYAGRLKQHKVKVANDSAVKIQCLYRRRRDREKAKVRRKRDYQKRVREKKRIMKVRRLQKAIIIQKYTRRLLVQSSPIIRTKKAEQRERRKRTRNRLKKDSVQLIQRNYRGWQVRAYRNRSGRNLMRQRNRRREKRRKARLALENRSAVVIQSAHRGRLTRTVNLIEELRQSRNENAAVAIQATFRGKSTRKKRFVQVLKRCRNAATAIQRLHRGSSLRNGDMLRSLRADRLEKRRNVAATKIQSHHRKVNGTKHARRRKGSIIVLQTWARKHISFSVYKSKRFAVIKIQNLGRKRIATAKVFELRKLRDTEIALKQERIRLLAQKIFLRKALEEKAREMQRKREELALIQSLHAAQPPPPKYKRRKRKQKRKEMGKLYKGDAPGSSPRVPTRQNAGSGTSPLKRRIGPESSPLRARPEEPSHPTPQNGIASHFEAISPSAIALQREDEFYKTKSPSPRTRRLYRIHTANFDIR